MATFGVHSEVGKLRKVIVHRPELSLMRLTPANHAELLFDDVLWVERAQWEHDQFVKAMRERGTEVRRERRIHRLSRRHSKHHQAQADRAVHASSRSYVRSAERDQRGHPARAIAG